jgi:uncharacterized protein
LRREAHLLIQQHGALIPHGPALAALILVGMTMRRQGLRKYWQQLTHWRAGWWYLVDPLVILGYTAIAFVINLMSGATVAVAPQWLTLGTFVQLLFFGGQWEEPGLTGYALPKLLERFADRSSGAILAALVVCVFRLLWHLRLFLYGTLYWFDIFIFAFAFQIIIAWLYDRSGKSVPAVMLFHFVWNVLGAILSPVFAGEGRLTFYALFMSLAMLFALVLGRSSQLKSGREKLPIHPRQAERARSQRRRE